MALGGLKRTFSVLGTSSGDGQLGPWLKDPCSQYPLFPVWITTDVLTAFGLISWIAYPIFL
eukprot:3589459-Amphidinium_carterae.1